MSVRCFAPEPGEAQSLLPILCACIEPVLVDRPERNVYQRGRENPPSLVHFQKKRNIHKCDSAKWCTLIDSVSRYITKEMQPFNTIVKLVDMKWRVICKLPMIVG